MTQIVSTPGGSESILLVDDDARIRDVVADQLAFLGYRVLVAEHGAAALEILDRGEAVDLLFTDVTMPDGMGGLELAAKARALRPALKVLYCSGLGEDAMLREGMTVAGGMLAKPFRRAELASRVRQMLDQQES